MFNKVLILSASAGAGHIRAAEAIEKAFTEAGAAREVRHLDALNYCSPALRRIYSRTYIDMVNHAPTVLGILYDSADKPWKDEQSRLAFDRLNTVPLARLLRTYSPDLVISTHFLPAEITSELICKKKISARHAVVITDFDIHSMWLCRHFDEYFVAIDEAREHLSRLGVSPDRITISGIPIDPVFALDKNKIDMRRKYGLREDLPLILLSAGGFGVGPVEKILQELQHLKHPAQVVALCGKNEKLKSRIDDLFAPNEESNMIVKPFGHTNKIDELMSAADLLLGKPGGLTTAEALSKGLAIVVVNPIPGQEERNSDHLLEHAAAIRCNNLPTLAFKIDRLLGDPQRLMNMKEQALRLSHPDSAKTIVKRLLSSESAGSINTSGKHHCGTTLQRLRKDPLKLPSPVPRERA